MNALRELLRFEMRRKFTIIKLQHFNVEIRSANRRSCENSKSTKSHNRAETQPI